MADKTIQLHKSGDTSELWFPKSKTNDITISSYTPASGHVDISNGQPLNNVIGGIVYDMSQKADKNDLTISNESNGTRTISLRTNVSASVVTNVNTVLGISSSGSASKFLNEKGAFVEVQGGGSGTVTGIRMNSDPTIISPDPNGIIDLGTVVTSTTNLVSKSSTAGLLKNDGSVDTSTYALSSSLDNYLPLACAGKKLTGNLATLSLLPSDSLATKTIGSSSAQYDSSWITECHSASYRPLNANDGVKLYRDNTNNKTASITIISNGGKVGILNESPQAELDVAGNIYASGGVTALYSSSSDKRLKKDIEPFRAMDIIDKLKPVQFHWNDKAKDLSTEFDDKLNYGLIAQDSEGAMDNLVFDLPNGYKGVRYEKLIPVLLQSIKELKNEVAELKCKI